MKINYDDEAVEVAEMIYRRLRDLELDEFIEGGREVQADMEQSIIDAFDKARLAVASDRLDAAIRSILLPDEVIPFPLPSGEIVELSRDQLLRHAEAGSAKARANIGHAILAALEKLAPEDTYTAELPLNVFAALDAMFQAVVVPLRLFDDAQDRCEKHLQAAIVIRDDAGAVVYDKNRRSEGSSNESAFWELVDLVLDRWSLRPRLSKTIIEIKPIVHRSDALDNAFAILNNIQYERTAA